MSVREVGSVSLWARLAFPLIGVGEGGDWKRPDRWGTMAEGVSFIPSSVVGVECVLRVSGERDAGRLLAGPPGRLMVGRGGQVLGQNENKGAI
ncbi:hypothetical protein C8R46DRAFT_1059120 [Mycena filopes]|nr:hypothetical protein C8R46DRAFT_1059120 [Mycena filopes]